jgi:hypothetical protein
MATPPVFTAGAVLTAAQMNGIGLWLVKSQTIGSAVSAVTVTDAFSADYDNYLITVNGGVASTTNFGDMTLGSTATGYYMSQNYMTYNSNTVGGISRQNQTRWIAITVGTTNVLNGQCWIHDPFNAKNTIVNAWYAQALTTGENSLVRGYLADTTSYTAFTLTASTGTWTGGQIRVYGTRN